MQQTSLHEHITGNYSLVTIIIAPLALTVINYCIVKRFFSSPSSLLDQALASWLILGIYLISWLFLFTAIIIQGGLGYYNNWTCEAAMLSCIALYAVSKFLLAFFLVEKAHIVRGGAQSRWKDRMFKLNLCLLSGYVGILVFLITRRWAAYNADTGVCGLGFHIGFESSLMVYDVLINFYLTAQFFVPFINIWRLNGRGASNPRLRIVARRTIIGNVIANVGTITFVLNLMVLAHHSPEPSGICLACCSADVTITAISLHWMSNLPAEYEQPTALTSQSQDTALFSRGPDQSKSRSRGVKKPHWDDDDFAVHFDMSQISDKSEHCVTEKESSNLDLEAGGGEIKEK